MHSSVSFALLGFSSIASSHMIMKSPTPFAKSKLAGDNGPLLPDGSNFPCKVGYDLEGASNVMPLGSKQELSFVGGATHGGGSCQVSLTYDATPTKSSKFKVIHSIIGGCPARNTAGNIGTSAKTEDPDKYEFPIPDNLPPGDAVLAWTWFNKIGNREMYMNCAPVKLTGGGAAKRDFEQNATLVERGMEAFDALPDMFVANIGNGCTTKDSTDLKFDNPGKSVDMISSTSLAGPVGSCASSGGSGAGASGAGAGAGSSGAGASGAGASGAGASGAGASGAGAGAGSSGAGASGAGASGAGASGAGAGAGSSGAGASGAGSSGAGASGTGEGGAGSGSKPDSKDPSKNPSGGSFYTVTSSEASKPTATSQDQTPAGKSPEPKPTSSTSDAKPKSPTEGSPKSGGSSAAAPDGATTGSSATGASQKSVGSQCSTEGAWNCMEGKSYQRCASGTWSAVMPLSAGTACNSNTPMHMVIEAKTKRALRIPRVHLRRHTNRMKFF